MIETKEFSVGTYRYRLTQFGAKKGQALLLTCAKIVGGSVAETAASNGGDVQLGNALKTLFTELSETTFARICEDFAGACHFSEDGTDLWKPLGPAYNDHFAGRYTELLKWLVGCFNANYESFFSELKEATGLQLSQTKKGNPSPPVLTGQSTE